MKTEQRRWLEQRDKNVVEATTSATENPRIVRDRLLRQFTEERTAELRARLKWRKEQAGMAGREDIQCFFDFIDADEKRR